MRDVERAARRIAADILINTDHGDMEGRLDPGTTEEFQAAVTAEVRKIGARIERTR